MSRIAVAAGLALLALLLGLWAQVRRVEAPASPASAMALDDAELDAPDEPLLAPVATLGPALWLAARLPPGPAPARPGLRLPQEIFHPPIA